MANLDWYWYGLDHLPAGTVRVRVRWDCYVVEAVATTDKKGRRHWHELRGRELVPLRPLPQAWQPLTADWKWPNNQEPEPLPVSVIGSVSSIGGASFDAAAAAEEMERDREEARHRLDASPAEDGGQWWRDVARIVYEPMGNVSREHGEARIMRALIFEQSIRVGLAPIRTNAATMVAIKMCLPADVEPCARCDGTGLGPRGKHCQKCKGYGVVQSAPYAVWIPPLTLQPEDDRDFDVVMGWFVEVLPSRREMLVLRARMLSPPATWRQIGDEIGRTSARARQIYSAVIDELVGAANRQPRRAKARLAELKERNREAKRA